MNKPATSQTVTAELRQWIIAQAEAGCSAESVVAAMRASGWDEDVAADALESTLAEHLRGQGLLPEGLEAQVRAAPVVAMPAPDLSGSPVQIDLGDRQVAVLAVMRHPRVVMFGGLLSDEECEALIAQARPRMSRSLTVVTQTGGSEVNDDRTSAGMFFTRGESELVARIEARLARLVNWPVENGEGIQVLRYGPGAQYKPHYDYFDPQAPGTPTILQRGGQRVGTVVMYLGEPEQGGSTSFTDIGLEVMPRRGNAVFFGYGTPDPSTRTLHGGAPVLAGEKWIATKWLREREFV